MILWGLRWPAIGRRLPPFQTFLLISAVSFLETLPEQELNGPYGVPDVPGISSQAELMMLTVQSAALWKQPASHPRTLEP